MDRTGGLNINIAEGAYYPLPFLNYKLVLKSFCQAHQKQKALLYWVLSLP